MADRVSFRFAGEFVAIEGDDQKLLQVISDDLAIRSPEGCDSVQEKRERVHAKLPKLLVLVFVALFQSNDV